MTERKYVNVHELEYSDSEVWELIKNNDEEALITLPIKLGFCHENWNFIQMVSIKLSDHPNETIRGNSFFGLQYAAMNHRKLEKNIVKPILLRGLKDESEWVRGKAEFAIEDINHYMNWNIGGAAKNKERVKAYYEKKKKGKD